MKQKQYNKQSASLCLVKYISKEIF